MSAALITNHDQGFAWHCAFGVRTKGYLFDRAGNFRHGKQLLEYFAKATNEAGLVDRLVEARGCFAVVLETDSHLLAAVDPVRSLPLFYAAQSGAVLVGDDVYSIQKELRGPEVIDPIAREEFLSLGYPVGPRTLDHRVAQIEAGEYYLWDKKTSRGASRKYFSHAHGSYVEKGADQLVEELDQITKCWVQRLVDSVNGRSIVIPLSGGYDSRYIACALRRAGYDRVICYSYGASSSYEWRVAKDVAERLGFPIHVVGYDRARWRATIESPQFLKYCRHAAQRCAVPHIQDFPACEYLTARNFLPADAVIVPGYCGDLQGGSYVPVEVTNGKAQELLTERIAGYLLRRLFDLRRSPIETGVRRAIMSRINDYTESFRSDDIESFCSVLEDWFTRHKVAKFVVNAVRVYEFFGHEWRLPLWDNDLINWWYRIPLRMRIGSVLYHRFLFERLFDPLGVSFHKRVPLGHVVTPWLPDVAIPAARWLYRQSLGRIHRKRDDVDAFQDASEIFLRQLPIKRRPSEFGNINGAVAVWCDAHGL